MPGEITGSDFAISPSARAVFRCDGETVSVEYKVNDKPFGADKFTRAEAVQIGTEIEWAGAHERFPIPYIDVNHVKGFGKILRRYGETGK